MSTKKRDKSVEARQRLLARCRAGPKCDTCGKRRALTVETWDAVPQKGAGLDWHGAEGPNYPPADWKPRRTCHTCDMEALMGAVEQGRKARAKLQAAQGTRKGTKRPLAAGRHSTAPLVVEGTMPMTIRLLKEGKTRKEIRKVFRELYHSKGKTDEPWIRARVRNYMRDAKRLIERSGAKGGAQPKQSTPAVRSRPTRAQVRSNAKKGTK